MSYIQLESRLPSKSDVSLGVGVVPAGLKALPADAEWDEPVPVAEQRMPGMARCLLSPGRWDFAFGHVDTD